MRTLPGIILQARRASSRLPDKALAPIGTRTLLEHCLHRLSQVGMRLVLATTRNAEDDALEAVAMRAGVAVFRGSAHDVLGRYVGAAAMFGVDPIVRATGDNPAVDVDAPWRLVQALVEADGEYACEQGLPLGAAVEVVRFAALCRAAGEVQRDDDREHVTTYVRRHPERFRTVTIAAPRHLCAPHVRLTVDTAADLEHVRQLFSRASGDSPSLDALIRADRTAEAA